MRDGCAMDRPWMRSKSSPGSSSSSSVVQKLSSASGQRVVLGLVARRWLPTQAFDVHTSLFTRAIARARPLPRSFRRTG
jgi:hypothetical protein